MRFPLKPDSSQSNHHGTEGKNTYAYKSTGHQTCLLMLSFHFIFSFSKHRFSLDLKNPSFQSISTNEKLKPITHWAHSSRRCPLLTLLEHLPHPNTLAKPGCPQCWGWSSSRLDAHRCWGCSSSMHDLRAPSPSHPACQSLPEPRVRCRSKMWQTEREEKTTGHLVPSLVVLERKACPDAKTKHFQGKRVLAPNTSINFPVTQQNK